MPKYSLKQRIVGRFFVILQAKRDSCMIIKYGKEYLKELYEEGKCGDRRYRFQPQIVKKYQKRVDTLIGATRKEDLFPFKSLNFEALHGDKEGMFSIRVDMQYRLEFSLEEVGGESLVTICQLEELSNHYK